MWLWFLFWCVLWAAVGYVAGAQRDRAVDGVLLCVLLGPIGLIILLVGADPRSERREAETRRLLETSLRSQLQAALTAQPPAARFARTLPGALRVARAGRDLGPKPIADIRALLTAGELAKDDTFFDAECQEWLPLELHPALQT